jgi:DNA-binding transcriptional regulator LsrR (DeoR family)
MRDLTVSGMIPRPRVLRDPVAGAELDSGVIGMSLDDLKAVPRVTGVARGARKIGALRGALFGRYMNEPITDRCIAMRLLAMP